MILDILIILAFICVIISFVYAIVNIILFIKRKFIKIKSVFYNEKVKYIIYDYIDKCSCLSKMEFFDIFENFGDIKSYKIIEDLGVVCVWVEKGTFLIGNTTNLSFIYYVLKKEYDCYFYKDNFYVMYISSKLEDLMLFYLKDFLKDSIKFVLIEFFIKKFEIPETDVSILFDNNYHLNIKVTYKERDYLIEIKNISKSLFYLYIKDIGGYYISDTYFFIEKIKEFNESTEFIINLICGTFFEKINKVRTLQLEKK